MKKDRNCMGATPYPIYPAYPGMMPQNMMPNAGIMMGSNPMSNQGCGSNIEQQISSLNSQVSALERRVSNLESLIGNTSSNQYNTSNYQMM